MPGYYEDPDWTVRDVVAHLGTWLAEAQVQFERIRAGTYEGHDVDIDAMNATFLAGMQGQSWDIAWVQANAGRTRMVQTWQELAEPDDEAAWWIRKSAVDHYHEHRAAARVGRRARRPAQPARLTRDYGRSAPASGWSAMRTRPASSEPITSPIASPSTFSTTSHAWHDTGEPGKQRLDPLDGERQRRGTQGGQDQHVPPRDQPDEQAKGHEQQHVLAVLVRQRPQLGQARRREQALARDRSRWVAADPRCERDREDCPEAEQQEAGRQPAEPGPSRGQGCGQRRDHGREEQHRVDMRRLTERPQERADDVHGRAAEVAAASTAAEKRWPRLERPRPEVAVGEHGEGDVCGRIDPQERPSRRSGRTSRGCSRRTPVRPLVVVELHAETPVAGLEATDAGHDAGQAGERDGPIAAAAAGSHERRPQQLAGERGEIRERTRAVPRTGAPTSRVPVIPSGPRTSSSSTSSNDVPARSATSRRGGRTPGSSRSGASRAPRASSCPRTAARTCAPAGGAPSIRADRPLRRGRGARDPRRRARSAR